MGLLPSGSQAMGRAAFTAKQGLVLRQPAIPAKAVFERLAGAVRRLIFAGWLVRWRTHPLNPAMLWGAARQKASHTQSSTECTQSFTEEMPDHVVR